MRLVRDAGLDPQEGFGRTVAELIMLLLIRSMSRSDDAIRDKIESIDGNLDRDPSKAIDVQMVELNRLTDLRKTMFDAISGCIQSYDSSAQQAAQSLTR